jgi:hypothetical protein
MRFSVFILDYTDRGSFGVFVALLYENTSECMHVLGLFLSLKCMNCLICCRVLTTIERS